MDNVGPFVFFQETREKKPVVLKKFINLGIVNVNIQGRQNKMQEMLQMLLVNNSNLLLSNWHILQ